MNQNCMGISAVILTHNDEKTLAKTLQSVAFCQEILIIDDDSTDNTKKIAKQYGGIVRTRSLSGNFAGQRNFGLSHAKHDWVLFVDADEFVSENLASEIQEAVEHIDVNGFFLKRNDVMWGKMLVHGETGNIRLLRLGRKEAGKWIRPVHEIWDIRGPVGTLNSALEHYPHPDVAQFLESIHTYSTINARYLKQEEVRGNVFHIIGFPLGKFIQNYFLRGGFLDGMPGMIVATMMSFHSFLTRAKLWLLWQK